MAGPIEGGTGLTGRRVADESLLEDEKAMLENDPGGMLRATAGAAKRRVTAPIRPLRLAVMLSTLE